MLHSGLKWMKIMIYKDSLEIQNREGTKFKIDFQITKMKQKDSNILANSYNLGTQSMIEE